MQDEDAVLLADDILVRIIQHQPQFITRVYDNNIENGAAIAKQILELRAKLIEGLKAQS